MSSQSTSKVIDNLHSTIDSLKTELNESKQILNEFKQKYSILSKRNEQLIEQLSNAKHQNDVSESLLKRKDRRIFDLEFQLTETTSNNDNFKFENENLKLKMSNFENEKFLLLNENERLTKSYDILQTSFNDFKINLNNDLNNLKFNIPNFINQSVDLFNKNFKDLNDLNPKINNNYNTLLKNSKRLDELYSQKFEKVNDSLTLLANSSKIHANSTSIVLDECENILKDLNRNEDVLIKIKNQSEDNLAALENTNTNNKPQPKTDFSVIDSPRKSTLDDITQASNNTTNNFNHKVKRDSINVSKKDRRKRNSYRNSMNQADFNNLSNSKDNYNSQNNTSGDNFRKRIASYQSMDQDSSTSSTMQSPNMNNRKSNRSSRNFSPENSNNSRNSRNFSLDSGVSNRNSRNFSTGNGSGNSRNSRNFSNESNHSNHRNSRTFSSHSTDLNHSGNRRWSNNVELTE